MSRKLIRLQGVKDRFGFKSAASVYDAIRCGTITAGVAISFRSKAWPDDEIDSIVAARIAGQTDEQIKALVCRLHAKRLELTTE